MTSKMAAIQALRTVRAFEKTRYGHLEQRCGAENFAITMALSCGLTRKQVFEVLRADMSENEALNIVDNFEKNWNRAFHG